MSSPYYNELWLITRDDLAMLTELDRNLQLQTRTSNPEEGLNKLLPIYLRYRNLIKRLIICHDQTIQPQKRALIKQVLDCAVGRMLEYKREIVNTNYSEYQWPDDFMHQLKYTPDDVEIAVSATGKDVVQQRREKIQRMIEDACAEAEEASKEPAVAEPADPEPTETSPVRRRMVREESSLETAPIILEESPEEIAAREARLAAEREMFDAILLLQCHERARIGRCAGAEVQRMYDYNKKLERGQIVPKKLHRATYTSAAKRIQDAWSKYLVKKMLRTRMRRAEELLGMTIPSWKCRQTFDKDEENFQKKLQLMPPAAEKLRDKIEKKRATLLKVKGPGIMEDITEEIREWFVLWYNELGQFGVFPAANLGGSVLIVTGETLTPREYLIQKNAKEAQKGKETRAKATPKKQKAPLVPETPAFTCLGGANQIFINDWIARDDTAVYSETIHDDLIKKKLCYQLQLEMREIVDELMRLELRKLNTALRRDCAADGIKISLPKEKRKKKRKGKRKKKDPFGDVSVEENFKELAAANIIQNYPVTSMKDWVGDLSYQNYEAIREKRDHKYRMGEVRQLVMEYCVLPLSSKEIHQVAPLVRSVSICGHPRHGKSFLVNAICSEVGAVLFDVSPPVLVDKCTGRKSERYLMDIIGRVAREFAPSIIFIDNGEKPWLKKVPPQDRYFKPKRFAKHFSKMVKSIKRGDQILFLTTSSEPYKATRPFVRVHDKFIMIPLTDYNTLYMFYKDLLMKYHGVDRDIDVSSIARMTVGIPLEYIKNAVDNVLNVRRRITLKFRPLNPVEIIDEVLKYVPPSAKTLTQMEKFQARTPLARKRAKYLARQKSGKA